MQQKYNISSDSGVLEAVLDQPKSNYIEDLIVIICHPHPLFDGTMHNKVVVTISRAFNAMGISAMRFNYRGVGLSQGHYDNGVGEVDDAIAVADYILQHKIAKKIIFAGFSFGGSVAYKAVSRCKQSCALLTIAPAVVNFPLLDSTAPQVTWCTVQGVDDEVVESSAVFDFVTNKSIADAYLIKLNNVGHFFHGQLVKLKSEIIWHYKPKLELY